MRAREAEEARLKSRRTAGAIACVAPTDYDARVADEPQMNTDKHRLFVIRFPSVFICVHLWFIGVPFLAHAQNVVDPSGQLERLRLGAGWLNMKTDVVVPTRGWTKFLSLGRAGNVEFSQSRDKRVWKATLADDGEQLAYDVQQTVREDKHQLVFEIKVTARADGDIEGIFFWIDVPAEQFAGGVWEAGDEGGRLPERLPDEYHLAEVRTKEFALADPTRKVVLKGELNPAARVVIQDGRKWTNDFSALIDIFAGRLPKGRSASLQVRLSTSGNVEDTPARVTLDAATTLYSITGIGGNYCFATDSPVTRYTLENLQPAFARTEMSLDAWKPQEDTSEDAIDTWLAAIRRDQPDSRLRREFELMREFSARKTPYVASVWRLPKWMYEKPPDDKHPYGNRLAKRAWPALLDAIGSYLLYAKEKYQAEPDLFSFNEPDFGVNTRFDSDEHRDAIKRVGAHFRKLGLKTKLLLGDTSRAADLVNYVRPATKDPEAMRYVGAVAFHSWGGATAEQYAAWPALAKELQLPLIVAEAGVDADAWKGARFHQPFYGVREMTHYQELLLHARPQAILYWEYTGDYSLLRDDDGLKLTDRLCFQKHWTAFIPPGSQALKTSSDHKSILFTAFCRNENGGNTAYSLHLANRAWSRRVTVDGIPQHIKALNAVRTSREELFRKLEPLPIENGKLELELPGQSLTTLTTLEIPELAQPVK
jgi:O-glycosyl hydrolase